MRIQRAGLALSSLIAMHVLIATFFSDTRGGGKKSCQKPLIAMGFCFRRYARLGPLRFNFAKGGLRSVIAQSIAPSLVFSGGTRAGYFAAQICTAGLAVR